MPRLAAALACRRSHLAMHGRERWTQAGTEPEIEGGGFVGGENTQVSTLASSLPLWYEDDISAFGIAGDLTLDRAPYFLNRGSSTLNAASLGVLCPPWSSQQLLVVVCGGNFKLVGRPSVEDAGRTGHPGGCLPQRKQCPLPRTNGPSPVGTPQCACTADS